jgi:uncharacterized protein with NRDE domain
LARAVAAGADPDALVELLADRSTPADEELPRRGRPLELERRVAPCFIVGEEYGTRASTAVVVERAPAGSGARLRVRLAEQEYGAGGEAGRRSDYAFEVA